MARSSLSNSPQNLNLLRRQADLFQRIILSGNHMSGILCRLDKEKALSKDMIKRAKRWGMLMVELVKMLF